jgi:curli biogenesis system outer membrane secretion channel CsgG
MKKSHTLLCFFTVALSLFVATGISRAKQTTEPTSAPSNQATETPLPDTSTNSENQKQNEDFQVFKPKEEISEDLSVPFPVDI